MLHFYIFIEGDNEIEDFPPPSRLRLPMRTAFRQINSAAPPDPYPRSKSSLSLPFLSIFEPATDVVSKLIFKIFYLPHLFTMFCYTQNSRINNNTINTL